jgi:hypothetical protein
MKKLLNTFAKSVSLRSFCVLLPLVVATAAQAGNAPFTFGLWGDMPYAKEKDEAKIPALVDSINASDVKFSIYVGDIKDGSSKCTEDVFSNAIGIFSKFKKPMVYIPGDNEWTDCHRLNNGGYHSTERLDYLRKVMFPTLDIFGKTKMPVTHQGQLGQKFVENLRFTYNTVVFVTLNIPGSNNNKVLDDKDCTNKSARTPAICVEVNAEYEERDKANIEWMKEAFKEARAKRAPGIALIWQGEPGYDIPETEDINERNNPMYSGYTNFLNALIAETEKFPGEVLVVNGDVHAFKVDKPLYSPSKVLGNLTRVQTFGSPLIHWVRVKVDPRSKDVFTVLPVIVNHK